MVKSPCCDKQITGGVKKGPWTEDEDKLLVDYIQANGHGSWRLLPKLAGLKRCGKSCRLRWTNYLRPDIKRGPFTRDEQKSIIQLHGIVGNKWSAIAAQLPGRTDNEVKNYWNTHLKKRLQRMGIDPETYTNTSFSSFSAARHMAQWESIRLEAEARLSRELLNFSTTSESTNHNEDNNNSEVGKKEPNDVFLRMWNSDIGKSFREIGARDDDDDDNVNVKLVNEGSVVSSSSNVNEVEESSDETYKFYMDLGGEDDEFSMFEDQMGSCFYSSLFSCDLNEVSLGI